MNSNYPSTTESRPVVDLSGSYGDADVLIIRVRKALHDKHEILFDFEQRTMRACSWEEIVRIAETFAELKNV